MNLPIKLGPEDSYPEPVVDTREKVLLPYLKAGPSTSDAIRAALEAANTLLKGYKLTVCHAHNVAAYQINMERL